MCCILKKICFLLAIVHAVLEREKSISNLLKNSQLKIHLAVFKYYDNLGIRQQIRFDPESLSKVQETRLVVSLSKGRKRQEGIERNDRARSRCTGNVGSDSGSRAT